MYKMTQENLRDVSLELEEMMSVIKRLIKFNPVVVRSNHDDHLDQWIRRADWKKDFTNSLHYIEMASVLLKEEDSGYGLIPYFLKKRFGQDIRCLRRDDSFKVKDWELAHHGDIGPNGSRGSLATFSKLNTKTVIAHSHTPGRRFGCIMVGTTTKKRIGYNVGASSWLHAHALGHEDGKVQLLISSNNIFTTIDK